jgi:hypothetical protein
MCQITSKQNKTKQNRNTVTFECFPSDLQHDNPATPFALICMATIGATSNNTWMDALRAATTIHFPRSILCDLPQSVT